ncbi:MAG: dTDP-4-dehydrorhamnose 3,5-epimerase [Promethearchaeota archaeon]
MRFKETEVKGLFLIEVEPFEDHRGKFYRVYCKNELRSIDYNKDFIQINQSLTKKRGTIRGMHFQYPPKAETKIIKCLKGSIFDVAIDLRNKSSTFLHWHSEILSADNMKMFFIPEGFAHGFQALEDNSELLYFHTEIYSPDYESGIRYDDPMIGIKWPLEVFDVSERDKRFELLDNNFKGLII